MTAGGTASRIRAIGLWLLALALGLLAWHLPRIAQPPEYHLFADQHLLFGIPHFFDASSNLLFVLAGMAGLRFVFSAAGRCALPDWREVLPYALFFFAVVLVGFASGYYHLAPDNGRLAWDRAAMALALMSWLDAILCERIGAGFGLRMLPALIVAGLGSVWYWSWSESIGQGDLRAYGLMQLIPLVFVPLLLRLYPPRCGGSGKEAATAIALYLLALLCDVLDRPIAALTGMVSGHTLKHVLAAGAACCILLSLKRRRPAQ